MSCERSTELLEVKLTVCSATAAEALSKLRDSLTKPESREHFAKTEAAIVVQILQEDSEFCHDGSHPNFYYYPIKEISWTFAKRCSWRERIQALINSLENTFEF